MLIKVLENQSAKDFIKTEDMFKNIILDVYISEWIDNKNVKLYLFYNDDNELTTFGLLNKMGRDPLKQHKEPYYLNYIYTFEKYRRNGYAYLLSLEIKKENEVTVFCTDDISQDLFKKAEYIFNNYDPLYKALPIYRFP